MQRQLYDAVAFAHFQIVNISQTNVCVCTYDCQLASNKLCGRPPQYAPAPYKLTFALLTLKVVSKTHVMWAKSVPILVCYRLRSDLRNRQTSDLHHCLMPSVLGRDNKIQYQIDQSQGDSYMSTN